MKKNFQNILILILAMVLIANIFFYVGHNTHWWTYVSVFIAIGLIYNLSALLINQLLDKIFPWETTPHRIYITVVSYLIVMLILSVIISYAVAKFFTKAPLTFSQFMHSPNSFFNIFGYYTLSLVFTFFFLSKGLFESLVESKRKEHELLEAKNKSEIQALKNQLDPHFLFNNLTVLYSLIDKNPEMAKSFTETVSNNYRDVLEAQKREFSSVEEECQVALNYFNLMKIRLGNSLQLQLDENIPMQKKLLPLSIQIGLENAIKHNTATEEIPLLIKIYSTENYLVVENTLQPKTVTFSSKTGLKNLQNRYQFYHKKLEIENNGPSFLLKIPFIN